MVTTAAFADDIALVIIGKYIEDIQNLFKKTLSIYTPWMDDSGLKIAKHKTEAVLISSRKKRETLKLQVGDCEIKSQPSVRYLGVMIDARLCFKDQVEHTSKKASAVGEALSRLMPNLGGPKPRRRALLSSVVMSILTYGIVIWGSALQLQECQRRIYPVCRQMALRVASGFRTVSRDAAHVISGLLPIEILAEEQRRIYRHRNSRVADIDDCRKRERQKSLQ
ncbi:uncharacterized protein LOC131663667 [Phymastichus coffea]|uniref:uncharacterized protein LOC131663667 n=1 Tax=Phymastichus coffea TaxID=108790 RepID=UPI00273B5875|nr:uncharacterized protein LOC131663667 [Phymastichus coffea]